MLTIFGQRVIEEPSNFALIYFILSSSELSWSFTTQHPSVNSVRSGKWDLELKGLMRLILYVGLNCRGWGFNEMLLGWFFPYNTRLKDHKITAMNNIKYFSNFFSTVGWFIEERASSIERARWTPFHCCAPRWKQTILYLGRGVYRGVLIPHSHFIPPFF